MDISDFSEESFGRGYGEDDLASLAAALGLSYEIEHDVRNSYAENRSSSVRAQVKLKGLKSKRYAVFVTGKNVHTKRFSLEVVLAYRNAAGRGEGLSPKDVRRVRDEAAAFVVENILRGCVVKASETRRMRVPPSSSVEEMKLKMAVAGGNI